MSSERRLACNWRNVSAQRSQWMIRAVVALNGPGDTSASLDQPKANIGTEKGYTTVCTPK
jgi:hypothetical protein